MGSHVREMTVLWKQFYRSWYLVSSCFDYEIILTLIMVFGLPKVPSVNSSLCPWSVSLAILVDNGLAPKWDQGVSVPIVWPVQHFICQLRWINTQGVQEIEGILNLWCQSIPQLEWKVAVCCSQCCNKSIFESLDHALSSVYAMVVGLHQLQLAIIFW